MRKRILHWSAVIVAQFIFTASCKRDVEPHVDREKSLSGYVIAREICHLDARKDYWLIDFTYTDNQLQLGDTLLLDGIEYTNVLKVKELDPRFHRPRMAVKMVYESDPAVAPEPADCDHPDAAVYLLKELVVVRQVELR
jgi:hypothetical protein